MKNLNLCDAPAEIRDKIEHLNEYFENDGICFSVCLSDSNRICFEMHICEKLFENKCDVKNFINGLTEAKDAYIELDNTFGLTFYDPTGEMQKKMYTAAEEREDTVKSQDGFPFHTTEEKLQGKFGLDDLQLIEFTEKMAVVAIADVWTKEHGFSVTYALYHYGPEDFEGDHFDLETRLELVSTESGFQDSGSAIRDALYAIYA